MLWNVFEVANHVVACACVSCLCCGYTFISMCPSHPVLSAGSHLSAPDLPTSGQCVCVCVCPEEVVLHENSVYQSGSLKSGLPVSYSPTSLSGPLTHH